MCLPIVLVGVLALVPIDAVEAAVNCDRIALARSVARSLGRGSRIRWLRLEGTGAVGVAIAPEVESGVTNKEDDV